MDTCKYFMAITTFTRQSTRDLADVRMNTAYNPIQVPMGTMKASICQIPLNARIFCTMHAVAVISHDKTSKCIGMMIA
ncbi:MAG: hypothetical protein Q6353_009630 [Candidatus Sigynarchaeum springense]